MYTLHPTLMPYTPLPCLRISCHRILKVQLRAYSFSFTFLKTCLNAHFDCQKMCHNVQFLAALWRPSSEAGGQTPVLAELFYEEAREPIRLVCTFLKTCLNAHFDCQKMCHNVQFLATLWRPSPEAGGQTPVLAELFYDSPYFGAISGTCLGTSVIVYAKRIPLA